MLYIYNLPQTFLCSDMQIGELRGGKDSDSLTRVRQCSQSQLGGFKISSGGGGGGFKQENAAPDTIVFSAFQRPVFLLLLIIIILSFFIIDQLLSGELRLHQSHPKKH